MLLWFLFATMFDNVLILQQKSFARCKYRRSGSYRIFENVCVTVISTEIQKIKQFLVTDNFSLSKSKSSYLRIVVTRGRRNSGDACTVRTHWFNFDSLPTIEYVLFSWHDFPYKKIWNFSRHAMRFLWNFQKPVFAYKRMLINWTVKPTIERSTVEFWQ